MDASEWLAGQLVDMQMKVESSQEKLVRYQKEHEILGIDEKQNITIAKLDELNKQLTSAESERMDKEALYRLVESGDPDAIASSAGGLDDCGLRFAIRLSLLETLRAKQAELKIQAADLSTQFGPSYPKLAQLNNQLKEIDSQIQAEMKKIAEQGSRPIHDRPAARKHAARRASKNRSRKPTSSTKAPSSTTCSSATPTPIARSTKAFCRNSKKRGSRQD